MDLPKVTRKEMYYAYLSGDTSVVLPKPITNEEHYLYYLCTHVGTGGGGVALPDNLAYLDYEENEDVEIVGLSNYKLLATKEVTGTTSTMELVTLDKKYRKILILLKSVVKPKSGTMNIQVNNKSYYMTNATSSTEYSIELELYSNNLTKIYAGSNPIGTRYGGWSDSVKHAGFFNKDDVISLTFATGAEPESGTVTLYAM